MPLPAEAWLRATTLFVRLNSWLLTMYTPPPMLVVRLNGIVHGSIVIARGGVRPACPGGQAREAISGGDEGDCFGPNDGPRNDT